MENQLEIAMPLLRDSVPVKLLQQPQDPLSDQNLAAARAYCGQLRALRDEGGLDDASRRPTQQEMIDAARYLAVMEDRIRETRGDPLQEILRVVNEIRQAQTEMRQAQTEMRQEQTEMRQTITEILNRLDHFTRMENIGAIATLSSEGHYSYGSHPLQPRGHFILANRPFQHVPKSLLPLGASASCTLVIACGLATLETAANSYAVVIGNPASASARLQFCQSWNGVVSFIGPLIASKCFFSGENANNLVNVQFLPEVSESALQGSEMIQRDDDGNEILHGPLYKQYNMIFAFVALLCYVGAQVTIASFFINYVTELKDASYSSSEASNFLSYTLITFTIGRFIATALATVFQSDFLLIVYACCAIAFNGYVCAGEGCASVGVLILLFFFEAPMYPTIFTLGTANLGPHTRRGAGILVMGVAGGAVFPPIQGAVAARPVRMSPTSFRSSDLSTSWAMSSSTGSVTVDTSSESKILWSSDQSASARSNMVLSMLSMLRKTTLSYD
ncbi:hypothetical protein V1506DRAFT_509584 [Lipomyces tetrasporus]